MSMSRFGIAVIAAVCLTAANAVQAATLYVDVAATGNNTGTNWADAFTNLQTAINAVAGDTNTIWVAMGTYEASNDVASSFAITNSLELYGGFTNGAAWEDRNVAANETILSGSNLRRVLRVSSTTSTNNVRIDGITLINGKRFTDPDYGSGIYWQNSGTCTVANCTFRNITAGGNRQVGVGMFMQYGTVFMTNVVLRNLTGGSRSEGVALSTLNTDLTVVDSVIRDNIGDQDRTKGTGLYFYGNKTLKVRNTDFINNTAGASQNPGGGWGSAVCLLNQANASFSNCLFRHHNTDNIKSTNDALANSRGTIYVDIGSGYSANFVNCTFTTNRNTGLGGAFYVLSGAVNIKNSILWKNSAAGDGDEIYLLGGSVTIDRSIITGTRAGLLDGASVLLLNISTNDPRFASTNDCHLMSTAGRWDPALGDWTNDLVTSYGIDEGDPTSAYDREPDPNGGRINLGRYGNTPQASKSPAGSAPTVVNVPPADVDHTSAMLKGQLTAGSLSDIRVYYGTNNTDLLTQQSAALYPRREPSAVFSNRVVGLIPGATYYYAYYASNSAGESWAATNTFVAGSVGNGGPSTVIHVDKDAYGANTGSNWFDAFTRLQDAVNAATNTTNEIWIANGTYMPGVPVSIAKSVNIYGGFAGGADGETNRTQRNVAVNCSALDGGLGSRVMTISGSANVLLDGVTVQGGRTANNNLHGAGIYWTSAGSLMVVNSTLRDNGFLVDDCNGAAIYMSAGTITLTNALVTGNFGPSRGLGGAIAAQGADLTIVDSVISSNRIGGDRSKGGALYFSGGTKNLVIRNTPFIANTGALAYTSQPGTKGSALCLEALRSARIENCLFRHHHTDTGVAPGATWTLGTLYFDPGAGKTVDVVNCTFAYNRTKGFGGAVCALSGVANVKNSILWTNSANIDGWEIYAATSTVTVAYSLIAATTTPHVVVGNAGTVALGDGLIVGEDPLYASTNDLHLKSRGGRWDPVSQTWVYDTVTSPAISKGDPSDPRWMLEPVPNGRRINMGAYGGTPYASMDPIPRGSVFIFR